MKNIKPEPKVVTTVCSLCDESWESHGDRPTTADCIRLLKARAERAERQIPRTINVPYPVYPRPIRWDQPWINTTYTVTCSDTTAASASSTLGEITYRKPEDPPDLVPAAA